MTLNQRVVQSIIAVVVGCLVAFAFLYIQENPRMFLGSVLEAIDPEMSRGDISYAVDSGALYVFAKQSVKGDLSIDIRFDQDIVVVDTSISTILYDGVLSSVGSGLLRVERDDIHVVGRDPIVTVPFVSTDTYILVSDAILNNNPLVIERL